MKVPDAGYPGLQFPTRAEHLTWAGSSFSENKSRGRHAEEEETFCWRAAPTCCAQASTIRQITESGVGYNKQVASDRAVVAARDVVDISAVQWRLLFGQGDPLRLSVKVLRNRPP